MKYNKNQIERDLRSDQMEERNRALRVVYSECYPMIRSFIADNNGGDSDAEDIFQDAMIVFYTKMRNPDFELNCQPRTYLYSVCKNLWLNKLKKNNKTLNLDDQNELVEIVKEDLEVLNLEGKYGRVMNRFATMGEKCRKVLYEFYFHRMSMHSIAEENGFANEQVAKNKKSRCLKKLKEMVLNEKSQNV